LAPVRTGQGHEPARDERRVANPARTRAQRSSPDAIRHRPPGWDRSRWGTRGHGSPPCRGPTGRPRPALLAGLRCRFSAEAYVKSEPPDTRFRWERLPRRVIRRSYGRATVTNFFHPNPKCMSSVPMLGVIRRLLDRAASGRERPSGGLGVVGLRRMHLPIVGFASEWAQACTPRQPRESA
jgi:hypothetical protein